jgi:hypothetical protein
VHSRLPLQPLHDVPDLSDRLQPDVEEARELWARYPAEITQVLISSTEKGFQNDGPEPEAMLRQGRRVIESYVHPRWPISTGRSGAFAEAYFLPCQKAKVICLLSRGYKRLFQRPSLAMDQLTL